MNQPSSGPSLLGIGLLSPFVLAPVVVAAPVLAITRQWSIAAWTAAITGCAMIATVQAAYRHAQKLR